MCGEQALAGFGAGMGAFAHHDRAVDDDVRDAGWILVRLRIRGAVGHGVAVEDHDGGSKTLGDPAASVKTELLRRELPASCCPCPSDGVGWALHPQ